MKILRSRPLPAAPAVRRCTREDIASRVHRRLRRFGRRAHPLRDAGQPQGSAGTDDPRLSRTTGTRGDALMADLSRDHFTIAIDQRGYNLSDHPARRAELPAGPAGGRRRGGVEATRSCPRPTIVGHDWGGVVVLAGGHRSARARRPPRDPQPAAPARAPARAGQQPAAAARTAPMRASSRQDGSVEEAERAPETGGHLPCPTRPTSTRATSRHAGDAALQHRGNGGLLPPELSARAVRSRTRAPLVKVQAPVLMIHGLDDKFLLRRRAGWHLAMGGQRRSPW